MFIALPFFSHPAPVLYLFSPVTLRLQRASEPPGETVKTHIPGPRHPRAWGAPENLISHKFLLLEQGPCVEQPCSGFYSIPAGKCTHSGLLSVCWTVSPSPALWRREWMVRAGPHSPLLCSVASSQEAGAGQQLGCAPAGPVAVPSSHGTSHHEGKRLRAGKWGGVRRGAA